MTKALYRKYRSKKFDEIVGQEHITTALANAISSNRIAHAYLFTGPRGVGKTSIARILAHEVNNLPYNEDETHLDIIEIDAASNRRIDEVRSLREKVHNAPTSAKYKVYIIDEVHMLTKEAFNALLKTLEEPPSHVIFILATTEVQKLPETIISRTQRYTFKPAEKSATVNHLQSIAKSEGIKVDKEAVELIAEHGRGSFRDSISLLDQIGNTDKKITLDMAMKSLGIAPQESIKNLVALIGTGSPKDIIFALKNLHEQGFPVSQIAKQTVIYLRQQLLSNGVQSGLSQIQTTKLIERLIEVPAAHDAYIALEIAVLEPVINKTAPTPSKEQKTHNPDSTLSSASPKQATNSHQKPAKSTSIIASPAIINKPEPADINEPGFEKLSKTEDISAGAGHTILDEDSWQLILQSLKQKHNTLYGIARMAQPEFSAGKLVLCFAFPFHQKRMNDAKNTKIVTSIIHKHTGRNVAVECIIKKPEINKPVSKKTENNEASQGNDSLDTISNIFGGGEILD